MRLWLVVCSNNFGSLQLMIKPTVSFFCLLIYYALNFDPRHAQNGFIVCKWLSGPISHNVCSESRVCLTAHGGKSSVFADVLKNIHLMKHLPGYLWRYFRCWELHTQELKTWTQKWTRFPISEANYHSRIWRSWSRCPQIPDLR